MAVFVGIVADDFYGVLVCTYRTVGAQTIEFGLEGRGVAKCHFLDGGQRGEGYVINDAHGEVVLGLRQCEVLVETDDLCRSGVLGGQAEASADNHGGVFAAVECFLDVQQQGLAVGSGFLGAVEYGYALGGGGDGCQQVLNREGTEQVYAYQADFLAFGGEVVYGFLGGLSDAAHGDDYAVGVFGTVVAEQVIFAAGDFGDFGHIAFDDVGYGVVVAVACLAVLEEYVAVFGHAARYGCIGGEGTCAEFGQCLTVQQGFEVFLLHFFHFLDFVRGAEAVKEVDKRYTAFDCGQVCHAGQVHNLLYRTFGKHCKSGLAY